MERVSLKGEIRIGTGKSITGKLRSQGLIPAVVYAKAENPVHIQTGYREFIKLLHQQGENVIIDLQLVKSGKTMSKTVIIKEIQYNPLKESIFHVDFQQIKLTENIKVYVPLRTVGDKEAPGVKEGGIVEHILREVEIECLPTQIPKEILVDTSTLNIGDAIHVKELKIPEGIKLLTDKEQITVHVKFVAEEKVEEEKPVEEAVEPEVIKQKKPEEEAPEEEKKEKK
ncbi:MAG: 50S ribosomal protein L25 [Candidatus Omnitrophica bacterium]|nr:50S ribosomal protein L25 [Candidatus Omnitrophota bacterium]MBU1924676.1 50S ribosomal protein L25 [Candidatus Omnitrophota bacterium]